MTGMTVNLMLVDQWLGELKASLEQDVFVSKSESLSHAFAEIMAVARLNLIEQAEKEQATLVSLSFREERGLGFSWNNALSPEHMLVRASQFLEAFVHDPQSFALLKAEFEWLRVANCEADFAHESFKIVKNISAKSFTELSQVLSLEKGKHLPSGSSLQSVTLHNLSESFRLSV